MDVEDANVIYTLFNTVNEILDLDQGINVELLVWLMVSGVTCILCMFYSPQTVCKSEV